MLDYPLISINVIFCSGEPFIKPLGNVTVLANSVLQLHCHVSGYPVKEILWMTGTFTFSFTPHPIRVITVVLRTFAQELGCLWIYLCYCRVASRACFMFDDVFLHLHRFDQSYGHVINGESAFSFRCLGGAKPPKQLTTHQPQLSVHITPPTCYRLVHGWINSSTFYLVKS